MHELLLFGQVPSSRHGQLLKILAGVTRMQPQRLIERHVVYRPERDPVRPAIQVGASQTVGGQRPKPKVETKRDMYYWQMVKELSEEEFGDQPEKPAATAGEDAVLGIEEEERKWRLEFQDLPDPALKAANLRMAQTTEIAQGDPHEMMKAQHSADNVGRYVSEYIDEGHRFVHHNAVIFLHRILCLPVSGRDSPLPALPALNILQPLDTSGGYVIQVCVRLQDSSKPEIMEKGLAEVMNVKNTLKGVVELEPAERLALDTRLKPKPG
ncbi:hypothetical protein K490DRAFT_45642 [Saccharata proteae CBS 121410]|uniref:Mediator of RNA polymerase II transcription subunit 18 n=1 Tax=Saccharata proteae CBS 121410 TaxID=1314787 RepID=A0A9P4HSZ0_9PEZI|nr:hypothetical protein K490DRAFT_45642 [Saccharata proteae CBS 121410]